MSAFSRAKPRAVNPLEKAVKKNPKYDYIQTTIDTGASLTKYLKRVEEIKTNYRYQQDEMFKRMKITTFVQLLLQVAEVDSIEKDSQIQLSSQRTADTTRAANALATMADRHDNSNNSVSPVPSLALSTNNNNNNQNMNGSEYGDSEDRHSTLQSLIRGVGELDWYEKEKAAARQRFAHAESALSKLQADLDLPYLLLDLRDKDEYAQCHVISAVNYPVAMLSRSVNNETPELLAYKNQPGKIIVVYDDDERIAPRAATTLVERGYDNLFLLSGGLKLAHKKFPQGLITGELPQHLLTPLPTKRTTSSQQQQGSSRSISSAMSNVSVNSTASSTATKMSFDRDDVEKLNHYLDENLMPHEGYGGRSVAGSRASSKASTISQASSKATNRTLTSIHEKPWK